MCNRIHATPLQSTVTLSSGTTVTPLSAKLYLIKTGEFEDVACMSTQKKVDVEMTSSSHMSFSMHTHTRNTPLYQEPCWWNQHHTCSLLISNEAHFAFERPSAFKCHERFSTYPLRSHTDTLVKQVPPAPYSIRPLRGVTEKADERRDSHWIQAHSCALCQAVSGAS